MKPLTQSDRDWFANYVYPGYESGKECLWPYYVRSTNASGRPWGASHHHSYEAALSVVESHHQIITATPRRGVIHRIYQRQPEGFVRVYESVTVVHPKVNGAARLLTVKFQKPKP
jgi:hypothetical protein